MNSRIVISAAYRDPFCAETVIDRQAIDDLRREAEGEAPDLEACERIRRRITDALRLIQDGGLGWEWSREGDVAIPRPQRRPLS